MNGEEDVDGNGKSKGGKMKMPKVSFSPGKTGSFDVTAGRKEGSVPSRNGDKDITFQNGSKEDKTKFGKLKLPKIEFTSPYSGAEDDTEMNMKLVKKDESLGTDGENNGGKNKSSKISLPGFKKKVGKGEEEETGQVVSSKARKEMLMEREGSESPTPKISIGFVSGRLKGQTEADLTHTDEMRGERSRRETDSREKSPRFKVPKFSLSPLSTGILHISPERSPRGSKSSLQCSGEDEASTGIRIQLPSVGFSSPHTSEEQAASTSKKGTVTAVTKSSKHT
ncbi:hypothetical protein SKAU_G00093340 [Synaphobranchus kaupii]|uniref:Uncharacterized protein n=1 Tax=Synaphobranchus kaupii TaxID=118154 RepID=A0A9Q1FY20_SYNKA|nr:hypothetical protein SKAU_G00093340 [Synaphobranchus kaupii]